jgi:branched-chain amino acid transport system ATP-binding protein
LAQLEVRGLSAGYGRAQVLFGVDLRLERGEVVALLGRNGAGKSTTLKAIMGLVPPACGEIRFEGRDISGLQPHEVARLGLGYVPEERRIFTDLTVSENLEVGRQPPRAGVPAWTEEKLFALFPALAPLRGRRGARMSGGEQQMLCIARTLAGNPAAILMDEPSEGLAPVVVEQVARAILELRNAGVSVLLAEQSRHFAGRVAGRAYLLDKGAIRPA